MWLLIGNRGLFFAKVLCQIYGLYTGMTFKVLKCSFVVSLKLRFIIILIAFFVV